MAVRDNIQKIAARMVRDNKNLRKMQYEYEKISRIIWEVSEEIQNFQWIHPVITTAPYDALRGAVRALSNLDDSLTIAPVTVLGALGEEDDKSRAAAELANRWERTLKAVTKKAFGRLPSFRDSVIWNALVYDEIVGQIVHLPTQRRIVRGNQFGDVRWDAAQRYGDWVMKLVDPKSVYVEYSEYMPERVLSVQVKTAQELRDFWGIDIRGKDDDQPWLEFDYVDYDYRMAWAVNTDVIENAVEAEGQVLLEPEPWLTADGKPVPFLPWIAVVGGTITELAPEYRRKPLLFSVVQAEQWATANIARTLEISQALAEAGAPRNIFQGPGTENVQVDYGEPGGRLDLGPLQTYQRIQALGLDPALRETIMMLDDAIKRTTVAEVLVTGAPVAGTETFSAYNLQVQTAVASLGGPKRLAETFWERAYEAILLISHYTGNDLEAYDGVERYVIDAADIVPGNIDLSVELKIDVPADRVQRVTAAVGMAQNLQYPIKRILDFLGETDPEGAVEEWKLEQMEIAHLQGILQRIQATASGELQAAAEALQQAMMQEQVPTQVRTRPGQEMMGVEGEMFNPAAGGVPPIMAGRGATFEGATGESRMGQEIAGIPLR